MIDTATVTLDVPDDAALPGLAEWAQPERVLQTCRDAFEQATAGWSASWQRCQPTEAVYQPGQACRIAYQLYHGKSDRPDLVYARWAKDERDHASARQAGPPDAPFALFRYPRDRRLRQIRSMRRSDWLRSASQAWVRKWKGAGQWAAEGWRCTPTKYVPESRLVCRLKGQWIAANELRWIRAYMRISRRSDANEQAERLSALERQAHTLPFAIPHVLGAIPELHLLATEFIRGSTLLERVQSHGLEALRQASRSLANIGRATASGTAERIDPLDVEPVLTDLAAASIELHPLCDALRTWAQVRPSPPHQFECVHGDLHAGQVLLKKGRWWVVDWERAGLGDPTQDITNLAAELESRSFANGGDPQSGLEAARACVAAWRAADGRFNAQSARWWATRAFVLRAWGLMRHLRPNWRRITPLLLERAVNAFQDNDAWMT